MNRDSPHSNPQELLQKGLAYHRAGALDKALKSYQRVIRHYPDNADAHHLAGLAEHALGHHHAAEQLLRKAASLNPANPAFHSNLGQLLLASRRYRDAIPVLEHLLTLHRNNPETLNNLGTALLNCGRAVEAAQRFEEALVINPGFMNARFNLGNSRMEQGDYESAAQAYRTVAQHDPGDTEAGLLLARALRQGGDGDAAIDALRDVVERHPRLTEALNQLGELYEQKSRLDEAMQCVDASLAIDRSQSGPHLLKAVIMRRRGDIGGALAHLEAMQPPAGNAVETQKYHFELGRLYDRSGDYARAFNAYSTGNRLQAQAGAAQADKQRYLAYLDEVERHNTKAWYASWNMPATTPCADTPVFLVSFPRSGTTLLDQILDSHPQLQVMEEIPVLSEVIREIGSRPGGYPGALATFTAPDIDHYRERYLAAVDRHTERTAGTRLVDKMPLNITEIRLIYRLFPDARIIFALRHPCDVCLSNFMQHFTLNDAMANFLDLGDTARVYDRVMNIWRNYTEILPVRVHTVRYESLVEDLEDEARKVLAFLGLEWDAGLLDYATHARSRKLIDTPSYQAVTEPVYTRARYRWKHYRPQLEPCLERLRAHVEFFGYGTD